MKKLKNLDIKISTKYLVYIFILFGFIAFVLQQSDSVKESKENSTQVSEGVDTFIPQGYVLIPLEISNLEALQGLLSEKGVVDLYFLNEGKSIKIGSRLKMIRAPLNPRLFAVLVKENESSSILKFPGPFHAVVQNTKTENGNVLPEKNLQNRIKIETSSEI